MPSDSASSTHEADDSADDSADRAAEPEAARAAEPEAAKPEAAPAADPDAWKEIGLHGQWKNRWFIILAHRVKDTSVLNDCHRLSGLHPLRANHTGADPSKKPTHLCVHSHFDDEKQLTFCLAPIVPTFSKVPRGTPKEHRNPKDAYNCAKYCQAQCQGAPSKLAMCQVVGKITTLVQCNSCYLGGYRQVLLHFLYISWSWSWSWTAIIRTGLGLRVFESAGELHCSTCSAHGSLCIAAGGRA